MNHGKFAIAAWAATHMIKTDEILSQEGAIQMAFAVAGMAYIEAGH